MLIALATTKSYHLGTGNRPIATAPPDTAMIMTKASAPRGRSMDSIEILSPVVNVLHVQAPLMWHLATTLKPQSYMEPRILPRGYVR